MGYAAGDPGSGRCLVVTLSLEQPAARLRVFMIVLQWLRSQLPQASCLGNAHKPRTPPQLHCTPKCGRREHASNSLPCLFFFLVSPRAVVRRCRRAGAGRPDGGPERKPGTGNFAARGGWAGKVAGCLCECNGVAYERRAPAAGSRPLPTGTER